MSDFKAPSLFSAESLSFLFLSSRALMLEVLAAIGSIFYPPLAWVAIGIGFGYIYGLSLIVTKRIKLIAWLHTAIFFSLSLLRIAFFGYAFLWIAQGDRKRVLLVLVGFLGYSSWIFIERLISALGVSSVPRKLSA